MSEPFSFFVIPSLLVLGIGLAVLMAVHAVLFFSGAGKVTRLKVTSVVLSVTITMTLVELMMRLTGIDATYMEKRAGYYWSPYDYNTHNILWNRDSGQAYTLSSQEFKYARKANSMGFIDKEFSEQTDSNEVKILCLGDSFTEGDGSPQDSCYPRQLEGILQAKYPGKKITVMNAGICGSDPVFNFKIYDSLMYKFKPQIVIQSFAKQDFNEDIIFRGGFERFTKNGLHFSNTFDHEKLYRLSYLSRLYFTNIKGYNFLFINDKLVEEKQPFMVNTAKLLAQKWDTAIAGKHFKLYYVIRPDVYDVFHDGYDDWFKQIINGFKTGQQYSSIIDLRPYFIDSSGMRKNINNYFWLQDGHNNSRGYHEMAKAIAAQIDLSN